MFEEQRLQQQCHMLFANYQMKAALLRLDNLVTAYKSQGKWLQAKRILQEFSEMYPDNVGLLTRLATIYQQMGHRREALEQLDKLSDIHHATGNFAGTVQTIRQIIELQKP